jgi:hypothetical protein
MVSFEKALSRKNAKTPSYKAKLAQNPYVKAATRIGEGPQPVRHSSSAMVHSGIDTATADPRDPRRTGIQLCQVFEPDALGFR